LPLAPLGLRYHLWTVSLQPHGHVRSYAVSVDGDDVW
jgi:hypothetical protein